MAIAVVAHVAWTSGGSGGGTTASINTTGADGIVIVLANGTILGTVGDNKGNTYDLIGLSNTPASTGQCSLWFVPNPVVGAGHTFSFGGTSTFPSGFVIALSGTAAFQYPIAIRASQTTTSGQTSTALTPLVNNCIVIAGLEYNDTVTLPSINGGFTITDSVLGVAGNKFGGALAYLIQTGAASAQPTWTWTNSVRNAAVLAVFQSTNPGTPGGGTQKGYASA